MHDIFRDGFFTASTHSALTSTITHKTSVYPAFWLPPISTCVTVSPVYLLENRTRMEGLLTPYLIEVLSAVLRAVRVRWRVRRLARSTAITDTRLPGLPRGSVLNTRTSGS